MISPTYTGQIYDSTSSTTTKVTGTESGMGQDAFLKMFMAQMTNQDPLNPMDSTAFTAQLAQFSSLEQLTQINKNLSGLTNLSNAFTDSQAISYLGKQVTVSGNTIPVSNGQAGSTSFDLASNANVQVIIYNSSGKSVFDSDLGYLAAGTHEVVWDGKTSAGATAPDGTYTAYVIATDTQGNAVSVSNQTVSVVATGYKKDSDGTGYLMVGGSAVPLSDVSEVRQPSSSTSTGSTSTTSTDSTGINGILEGLANLGTMAASLL